MSEVNAQSVGNESTQFNEPSSNSYLHIPYGFQFKANYKPKTWGKDITEVTYNSKSKQFIILDSKGITAWSPNSVINSVLRVLDYPSYHFNVIRLLLHCKKFNVYFGLSKDYALKVFNTNFHEVFSVVSDMNSVLCMVFNSVTDELITGGTGGIRFWSFGEVQSDDHGFLRNSRPMANYGLILRRQYLTQNSSMVKDIIIDEKNQRLYCLSERNVIAQDMKGNILFELKNGHQGHVTGCIHSNFSNLVVTSGSDCTVNVWSTNGGKVHSFHSHSKMITNLHLHPEAPSLVITSSLDGTIKIFSLDIMEEIYSKAVLPEGVMWMNLISHEVLYCASNKTLQVFHINHVVNFWLTVRCPLKSLTADTCAPKILAISEDYCARFVTKDGCLLSMVLPPPPAVTTGQQFSSYSNYAYCPPYSLVYLLVSCEEIWVYYAKSNPANRVEVWKLRDIQDISDNHHSKYRTNSKSCMSSSVSVPNLPTNRPGGKCVDFNVKCLSLLYLQSKVALKTTSGENLADLSCFLVLGLQDGQLLFTSPYSALTLYYKLTASRGAILCMKHDAKEGLLLLHTLSLDKHAIRILGLPEMQSKHVIEAGVGLTCFVKMNDVLLTGYESGQLNLYYLTKEQGIAQQTTTQDNRKSSKDHMDSVIALDVNFKMKLFCSSSKDSSVKVWSENKVLLREIVLDNTLNAVCFLNSRGDLLVGFKNHIFLISYEKAQLSTFGNKMVATCSESDGDETASDVYEDPRIRKEFKKSLPPEPVRMETYLVPHTNISIDLTRLLFGHGKSNATSHVSTNDEDENSASEISDAVTAAPTEIYQSQSSTPLSRSRSSSFVGSWNLPKVGSSPVSSPPRTPPPVMNHPVLTKEKDDVSLPSSDDKVEDLVEKREIVLSIVAKPPEEKPKDKPIFSRSRRTGLSEIKIDSRSLQSKVSIRNDLTQNKPGTVAQIVSTKESQLQTTTRPVRKIIKKTKIVRKKTHKNTPEPRRELSVEGTYCAGQDLPGKKDNIFQKQTEEIVGSSSVVDNRNSTSETAVNEGYSVERLSVTSPSVVVKEKDDGSLIKSENDCPLIMNKSPARMDECRREHSVFENFVSNHSEPLKNNADMNEETRNKAFRSKSCLSKTKQLKDNDDFTVHIAGELSIRERDQTEEHFHESDVNSDDFIDVDDGDSERTNVKRANISPFKKNAANDSLVQCMKDLGLKKRQSYDDRAEHCLDLDCEIVSTNEVNDTHLKHGPVNSENVDSKEDEDGIIEVSSMRKPSRKSVSFFVSRPPEDKLSLRIEPMQCAPGGKISGRRSVSPSALTEKVVPVLDVKTSEYAAESQWSYPTSSLKIYALAKTRQQAVRGRPLVSRPRDKPRSCVKHVTSEMSIARARRTKINPTKINEVVVNEPPDNSVDILSKRNENTKKKDLMSWCVKALTEKHKYPVLNPKPRLRSRKSMLHEQGKQIVDTKECVINERPASEPLRNTNIAKLDRSCHKPNDDDVVADGDDIIPQNVFKVMFVSRHAAEDTKTLDYSEGWQMKFLERLNEMKAKHCERSENALHHHFNKKQMSQEKKSMMHLYGSSRTVSDTNNKMEGVNMTKIDSKVCGGIQSKEDINRGKSQYEMLKNKPVITHPYRLEKPHTSKSDVALLKEVAANCDYTELPTQLWHLIPRPKSAPSIPSKCRKFVLVSNESQSDCDKRPEPTAIEKILMLQRFPNTTLQCSRSRSCSPVIRKSRPIRSLYEVQNVNTTCIK
ncbi:uncharacterized protein LOC124435388 [Xenia sp. Carnegie-2017]|uniref:uncharacterized protein LOC124435388 n=1 Tax=Xenia sp. Carnegie-2017 TaxID=2897299 RepID=UPI001F04BA4E|nr:uncharacterized protein LOC124435388 [Xenia sp. Carnegie-2017]